MKRFNIAKGYGTTLHNFRVPKNAWYGQDEQGIWVCTDHTRPCTETPWLEFHRYNSVTDDWEIGHESGATVLFVCNLIEKLQLWGIECSWHSPRSIKLQQEYEEYLKHKEFANMMRHERRHKHSSGGQREVKNRVTDYECTKNPIHDFRRGMDYSSDKRVTKEDIINRCHYNVTIPKKGCVD